MLFRSQENKRQIVEDGISEKLEGVVGAEQVGKVGKTCPGALENPDGIIDFFKSQGKAGHWHVIVDDQINGAGDEHQVERQVPLHFLFAFSSSHMKVSFFEILV